MNSTFHMLCLGYSGPVTSTAPTAIRLWETFTCSGNKLKGDVGDIVPLQAQTSPLFQLREKFKCIEHIGKSELQFKPSP